MSPRVQSTVKSWNQALRFGFLHDPACERGVYVNYKDVPLRDAIGQKLKVGETVEFVRRQNVHGWLATEITFPTSGLGVQASACSVPNPQPLLKS